MQFELKKTTQSPEDILTDRVYAAMETGNANAARVAIAEVSPELALSGAVPRIRAAVMVTYGIRL